MEEVGSPGLAKVGVEDVVDVDDGVGCNELEEPAKEAAEARSHDDGAGGRDAGVGAFFREMKWGVIAGHGPDHRDEGHDDCNTVRKVGAVVKVAPNSAGFGETWEALIWPVGGSGDNDDDNNEGDDVEARTVGVERGDPARGHRGDDAVDDHNQSRQEEDLIVLRDVIRIGDGDGG